MKRYFYLGLLSALTGGVAFPPPTFAQDTTTSRSLEAVENAKTADVAINQVDTSKFPEVNIFATVMREGVPVLGLKDSDFKVREDEVDQEPLTVTPQRSPLSLVVALDTSGSMSKAIATAKSAAAGFISQLDPSDSVAVVTFARSVTKASDFATDKGAAQAAISSSVARGDTALLDAIFQSVDLLNARAGRKAVVLLSDGRDDDGAGKQLSAKSIDQVVSHAKLANVPVFAIGLGSEIDRPALQRITAESGGKLQEAATPEDLKRLYDGFGQQLSGQYNLHYRSNLPGDGSIHRIQLTAAGTKSIKEYASPRGDRNVIALKQEPAATPTTVAATPVIGKPSYVDAMPGDSFDSAIPMEVGVTYRDKREYDGMVLHYGRLDPQPGKRYVVFSVLAGKHSPRTLAFNTAKMTLYNGKREQILDKQLDGGKAGSSAMFSVSAVSGGNFPYFFAVYSGVPTYMGALEYDASDAGSGTDAASGKYAVSIQQNSAVIGNLGGIDDNDNYVVETTINTPTFVKARPSEGGQVKIKVLDPDGVSLGEATSPNPGAIAKLEVQPSTKKIEVIIENFSSSSMDTAYGLVIGGPDVESPTQPEVPRAPVVTAGS